MGRFDFKHFSVDDQGCGMKICSDSVLLAAWFLPPYDRASRLVDIGSGSGVLSLLGAQICGSAFITALEIEASAAEASRLNFEASQYSARLEVVEGNFADWHPEAPVGLIISNPPYFTNGEHSGDAARRMARHQDGLTYISLLEKSAQWLSTDGHTGLISPSEFEADIIYEATKRRLYLRRLLRVRTSPSKAVTRVLFDFSMTDGPIETSVLDLRNSDGSYTDDYVRLVGPYYLKI